MSNEKIFKVSHAELTTASPLAIWQLWSDINNWPKWDLGLASCRHEGEFKSKEDFWLTPKGSDNEIKVTLQEVEPQRKFSDLAILPFGTLEAIHELATEKGKTKVTHVMVATVKSEDADFFAEQVWCNVEAGLPKSVKALVNLAEAQTSVLL